MWSYLAFSQLILFQLLIPISLLVWLVMGKQPSLLHLFVHLAGISMLCYITFMIGRWDWLGYYVRYLVLIAPAAALAPAFLRHLSLPLYSLTPVSHIVSLTVGLFLSLLFAIQVYYLHTRDMEARTVELSFPFKGIDWYIGQGGENKVINVHSSVRAQRYALDILAVNRYGFRARAILPQQLEQYEIYNQPVYSPCDGDVLLRISGHNDLIPPIRDEKNIAGNAIAISCHGVTILLAHLKQGSLLVQLGDSVHAGQVIARVGNSGNTTEPHLHIHAVMGRVSDPAILFNSAEPVIMTFSGKTLRRNDKR